MLPCGEEEYEDYGSGESSGDFYEYETKYYFIPYCHKHEEQQQTCNKDIHFIHILTLSYQSLSFQILLRNQFDK